MITPTTEDDGVHRNARSGSSRPSVREAIKWLSLVASFAAAILLNDVVLERQMGYLLSNHPQIVLNALAQAQSDRASASAIHMQQQLSANWGVLSQTHAYAVRFNGSQFTSRWVRIGEVATAKNLNLVATDYRCHFCKADRGAVDAMLRANPDRDYVFIEAAVLGPESIQLANETLRQAQHDEADYYAIHNRQFDAPPNSQGDQRGPLGVDLLKEQRQFLDTVGVFATPTYIRDGVIQSGALGVPDG